MLTASPLKHAANLIIEACRAGRPLEDLPESCRPTSVEDAYRIQNLVFDSHCEREAGWFVAATNPQMQRQLGLDEAYAARWGTHRFLRNGTTVRSPNPFPVALEAEVSFRIGEDLPAIDALYTRANLESAIASVHPSVEVVISCFTDWMNQAPLNLIAEGGLAQFLIYGDATAPISAIDLAAIPITVSVNEKAVAHGTSANVMNDPMNVMIWLANHASRRGLGLRAGQLCNTGMCAPPCTIGPSDHASVDFGPLGRVALTLAARDST